MLKEISLSRTTKAKKATTKTKQNKIYQEVDIPQRGICTYYIEDDTLARVDMEFLSEYLTRWLTSEMSS